MSAPWRELLPTSLDIGGVDYEVRSDYRAVLDVCAALSDTELGEQEKVFVVLDIFYPTFSEMPQEQYQSAIERCFWFINCGEDGRSGNAPKLMDWEQDFKYVVAPINRIMGAEVRAIEYLHWWSFIAAYYEIGDCLFAQIVRIRKAKAAGKSLDKSDQAWYRENQHMVDMKSAYTEQEEKLLKQWGGG